MIQFLLILMSFIQFKASADSIGIQTKPGTNHLVHFSNKTGTFWVGETNKETHHFLMGLISHRETIFSDYSLYLNNRKLERESASIEYYPWLLKRTYGKDLEESVFMPDEIDGLHFNYSYPSKINDISFTIFGDDFKEIVEIDTTEKPHFVTVRTGKSLNTHVAVATDLNIASALLVNGSLIIRSKLNSRRKSGESKANYSVVVGSDSLKSVDDAIRLIEENESLIYAKKKRISELISSISFKSNNPDLDKSLRWAISSFDNLNMNETRTGIGKGIYAGYPWFQDYWGRDSFIALRALTMTGQFNLAKENLLSFLKYQVQDSSDSNYGKIPNRVRPDESIYNTADATPRFIIEAYVYYQFSGDKAFLNQVMPYINHAIKGTIQYRTDESGFLIHAGADTWMDAVGPKGPYSPRQNKANDIQALWIMALESASKLAGETIEYKVLAKFCELNRDKVKNEFKNVFLSRNINRSIVYDAINESGDHSDQIRINQLFTLPVISEFKVKAEVIRQVTEKLGTAYGPLSLSMNDPWFHPYHKMEPVYEQDAAYHNGIIWVWNTGDLVGSLLRYGKKEMGFEIMENYSKRMLSDVALGTLPELYDSFARYSGFSKKYPSEDEFEHISRFDQMSLRDEAGLSSLIYPPGSGTFSQAWSLSEYIRMLTEHLPGVRFEDDKWIIRPILPVKLNTYSMNIFIRKAKIHLTVSSTDHILKISNEGEPFTLYAAVPNTDDAMRFEVPTGNSTIIVNEFEQRGYTDLKTSVRLYREANLFKEEALIQKELGELKWLDYSYFDAEAFPFKSQTK